jgi:hypothetical protein
MYQRSKPSSPGKSCIPKENARYESPSEPTFLNLAEWSAISGSRAFKVDAFAKVNWELYDLRNDFSEADDLAAKEPAKLKEMQALFDEEAKRNNVYPLDDRFAERADARWPAPRHAAMASSVRGARTARQRPRHRQYST